MGGENLDGFDCEGRGGVSGEHADEDVVYDFGFCAVGGGDVDEDVPGGEGDFAVVRIYYWRHGADCSVGVEDYGIDGGRADDGEEFGEVLVILMVY